LCSMVVVVCGSLSPSGLPGFSTLDRHRILGHAFHWLQSELPRIDLPATVEEELGRYAWGQLT
jgi:hypothetical protein